MTLSEIKERVKGHTHLSWREANLAVTDLLALAEELTRERDSAYKIAADALAMPNWNQDEMILALTNICKTLGKEAL